MCPPEIRVLFLSRKGRTRIGVRNHRQNPPQSYNLFGICPVPCTFHMVSPLILKALQGRYYLHFADDETEAFRDGAKLQSRMITIAKPLQSLGCFLPQLVSETRPLPSEAVGCLWDLLKPNSGPRPCWPASAHCCPCACCDTLFHRPVGHRDPVCPDAQQWWSVAAVKLP